MEIKSKFLCSKGVALAFAMLLGGSPGVLLYANDSVEESLMVAQAGPYHQRTCYGREW